MDGDVASWSLVCVMTEVILKTGGKKSFLHLLCSPFLLCFFSVFCVPLYPPLPPGPHSFQERLAASQEAMKNKNVVNLGAIRQGMKRFQFLLNCCEPGTIPDASILAAALDLVRHLCFLVGPVSHCQIGSQNQLHL